MIHKYFTFADKKIKVIMYKEQVDQVSGDLLKEIYEKPEAIKKSDSNSKNKNKNKENGGKGKVVVANKKIDLLKNGNYNYYKTP